MATLEPGKQISWDQDKYTSLNLNWANPLDTGRGTVTVEQEDNAASFPVPQRDISIIYSQPGTLRNRTDRAIDFKLA